MELWRKMNIVNDSLCAAGDEASGFSYNPPTFGSAPAEVSRV